MKTFIIVLLLSSPLYADCGWTVGSPSSTCGPGKLYPTDQDCANFCKGLPVQGFAGGECDTTLLGNIGGVGSCMCSKTCPGPIPNACPPGDCTANLTLEPNGRYILDPRVQGRCGTSHMGCCPSGYVCCGGGCIVGTTYKDCPCNAPKVLCD